VSVGVPTPSPDPVPPGLPFPVVGVGASAGGLEAFTELLQNLPPDPGLAILFVQHLEPTRKSQLPEILSGVTGMPVREAAEGLAVEKNHVYLIPPNTNLALTDGTLSLTPRQLGRVPHMPIDHLFRSLAAVNKSWAIGVILSGSGTDGTLGFQAIKAEGGITFAQSEQTARHDSMPRSAVADGGVDYVLPPAEIARQLVRIAGHSYATIAGAEPVVPEAAEGISSIVNLLRAELGVDFSHYKRSTVSRRIHRRMALRGIEDLDTYLNYLREEAAETRDLYQDLLIRVTQFFRDPEAFEALKEQVFPNLVRGRSADTPLRIWVAGCSTGEEAYSLAICLLEFLDSRQAQFPIKILATDINEASLDRARAGVYVDNIELDVSPERLRRFLIRSEGHYKINKAVRELCVFSRHNMATDPPFSRLDLVSCRNVLIYMDLSLQKHILPIFHYALNPGGFLFLGASENVGGFTDLFTPVDARARIFARSPTAGGMPLDFGAYVAAVGERSLGARPATASWSALDMQKEADRIVQARYAPVGVVVDEALTVLQFRGRTREYLEPAPGTASLDLLKMLREGLMAEVHSAINQARAENAAVTREGVRLKDGGKLRLIKVEVIPFKVPPSEVRCFLVLFQDIPPAPPPPPAGAERAAAAPPEVEALEQQVAQLHQELASLREYLQSIIEEHEATNEELKSASEELLSSNEELQSTNEELQTAKEEAQSAYEELATVNEELRHRNQELAEANADLQNLLSGVGIPIVLVSRDLHIRRFTPLAEKVFNLIPGDVGRPISDIKSNLDVPDLAGLIVSLLDNLVPHESEVRDRAGRWYSLRIRPYVTLDNKIDGASITLLDIDSIKRHSSSEARSP
jgi:two-component system CheB/CheR fusion protein